MDDKQQQTTPIIHALDRVKIEGEGRIYKVTGIQNGYARLSVVCKHKILWLALVPFDRLQKVDD